MIPSSLMVLTGMIEKSFGGGGGGDPAKRLQYMWGIYMYNNMNIGFQVWSTPESDSQ